MTEFDSTVFADAAFVMAHATQVGSGVVTTARATDTVTLVSTQLSSLHANDFRFV